MVIRHPPARVTRPGMPVTAALAAVLVARAFRVNAGTITSAGQPAQLDVRTSGDRSVRVTLRPLSFEKELPFTPALVERRWPAPEISLRELDGPVERRVGRLRVVVRPDQLSPADPARDDIAAGRGTDGCVAHPRLLAAACRPLRRRHRCLLAR
jgi:hypothetical protein